MKKKSTKSNGPAIDATELIIAMEDLEKENGINKEELDVLDDILDIVGLSEYVLKAYLEIARRILGENLEVTIPGRDEGILTKIKSIFKKK